jgi:hypothetical protein
LLQAYKALLAELQACTITREESQEGCMSSKECCWLVPLQEGRAAYKKVCTKKGVLQTCIKGGLCGIKEACM